LSQPDPGQVHGRVVPSTTAHIRTSPASLHSPHTRSTHQCVLPKPLHTGWGGRSPPRRSLTACRRSARRWCSRSARAGPRPCRRRRTGCCSCTCRFAAFFFLGRPTFFFVEKNAVMLVWPPAIILPPNADMAIPEIVLVFGSGDRGRTRDRVLVPDCLGQGRRRGLHGAAERAHAGISAVG